MSNKNKIFIGVFSFLVIAGLVLFYFFNPKKAVSLILPDLSRITYINADIEKDSIRTKINVVVQNKSPYKLTIENIYFEIKLDDKLLARQTIPLNLNQ
ncbi:MAG TPA: hypothetical protein VLB84_16330, partial [Bacteroidia bacterium]|nr:hypothetical protein [Bacteroidia bacterium]